MADPGGAMQGSVETQASTDSLHQSLQRVVSPTQTELAQLWRAIGLSESEEREQKAALVSEVERACRARLGQWRSEAEQATKRVDELEIEIRVTQRQFQPGKHLAQSLKAAETSSLRDRIASLEVELAFLESIRNSRVAEVKKLEAKLAELNHKLGATPVESLDENAPLNLSDEYKELLQQLVQSKMAEVQTRRAALMPAVHDCVKLAQELQLKPDEIFDSPLDVRLKNKELSIAILEKVSQRIVELREMQTQRHARLAEMVGLINELWEQLQVPEKERERFRKSCQGVGTTALASCEAELARLQRHRERTVTASTHVAILRGAIMKRWEMLSYSPEAREYFSAMMNVPDHRCSHAVLRAHEKQVERLNRHVAGMKRLVQYVIRREEIIRKHSENVNPDAKTRARFERELPKLTAILNDRIPKWETEAGVPFCWKGQPYLKFMQETGRQFEEERKQLRDSQLRASRANRTTATRIETRHSVEERVTQRSRSQMRELPRRRSESQATQPKQHRFPSLRAFLRDPLSRKTRAAEQMTTL